MKIIRNEIFETNSSSTHSLTYLKRGHSLPKRAHKKNWQGKELPIIYDEPNLRVEIRNFCDGTDNSDLSPVEFNACYLFTVLQLMLGRDDWNGEHTKDQVQEALAQFHHVCLENDLVPKYELMRIKYHVFDYNRDGEWKDTPKYTPSWELEDAYIEQNDGGFIESLDDIWEIIDTPEHFKEFLTKGKIKIKYCG